jgi:ElaB/YqjD/DUF883 family membrane-anchored ribosome-binding protein
MSFMSHRTPVTREEVQAEIDNLVTALRDLKNDTGHTAGKRFDGLKSRAEQIWEDSRSLLDEHYPQLRKKGSKLSRDGVECVREHPLATLAIGVGAAALIGWWLSRR